MEPLTAGAIATLAFTKAFEKTSGFHEIILCPESYFNAEERGGKRRVTQSFRDKFST